MKELFLKHSFSDSDKEQCIPIIYRIIDLANQARKNGILALEVEIMDEPIFLLQQGIGLVVDGTDPVLVRQILQNFILSDKYSGFELLSRLVITEGILAIQQGENPRIMALRLSSMLGEKYTLSVEEAIKSREEKRTLTFNKFFNKISENTTLEESAAFESQLLLLDDRSLQALIRGSDSVTLATALKGCSANLINKITMNISLNSILMMIDTWEPIETFASKERILSCQETILKILAKFVEGGEIIFYSRNNEE